ncbi:MAG TPA: RES domain-containing protein [Trueperaceae bacterium]|nr:RES domain-containing protein [Trueperaceae bacterium]
MLSAKALEEKLKILPVLPFSQTSYRLIHAKYYQTSLSAIGSRMFAGRYNPKEQFEVLYLSDSPITALQEVNAIFRSSSQLFPVKDIPRILLSIECQLTKVLDLTDDKIVSELKTSFQELTGSWLLYSKDSLAPTQLLGKACFESGIIEALKVPSAQDPRAFNLAIFPERLQENSRIQVFDDSGFIDAVIEG